MSAGVPSIFHVKAQKGGPRHVHHFSLIDKRNSVLKLRTAVMSDINPYVTNGLSHPYYFDDLLCKIIAEILLAAMF